MTIAQQDRYIAVDNKYSAFHNVLRDYKHL